MNDLQNLQSLVAEVVREVVAEMSTAPSNQPVHAASAATLPSTSGAHRSAPGGHSSAPGAQYVTRTEGRVRTKTVRIGNDQDLESFVRYLLDLFDNPKNRADLRNGWLRFALAGTPARTTVLSEGATHRPLPAAVRRVPKGAVTERAVVAAADAGERLVLAKGAVVTPLARERARALGVLVEKEK